MAQTFEVHVKNGKNLLVKDVRTSDPYLKIYLKNQGESSLQKTTIKKSDLNPEWNENFIFTVADPNDVLVFEMYDSDNGTKDDPMMNPLEFPVNQITHETPLVFDGDIKYKEKDAGHLQFEVHNITPDAAATPATLEATPAPLEAVPEQPKEVAFDIRAVKASNLIKADADASDPYMVFYLKNLGRAAAVKTEVVKNNLNPEWNSQLLISTNDLTDSIVAELWDKDISKDDPLMDPIEVPLASVTPETPFDFDQDIKKGEKPAGHLEFHITRRAEPAVQSRDIQLEPGTQCHFDWGNDGSSFSTSFTGYSQCSKTLDDILQGQDFDHVHATLEKETEPQPPKPKKVEEVTGTLVKCENLTTLEDEPLNVYATVQLIGRSAIGKGKGTLVQTDPANNASPEFNKEFKLEKGRSGDSVQVIVYQQHSQQGVLRIGYARIPILKYGPGPNEAETITLLKPRKFNGENALEGTHEAYGTVTISINRNESFVEPEKPAPAQEQPAPAPEQPAPQ